ncbi:ComF family protein [Candidatus Bipolaricaulota bacterium]
MGKRLLGSLAAALFPPRCVLCSRELHALDIICSDCIASLPSFEGPRCECCGKLVDDSTIDLCIRCGTQRRWVDRVFSLGPYQGSWGHLVQAFKFEREIAVGRWLGEQMAEALPALNEAPEFTVITFVPMTRQDRRQRGFNQAEVLARIIAKQRNLPVIKLLAKTHKTPLQSRLTAVERKANLRDAFRQLPCELEQVLLIDDIYTTGSTVEECARMLKLGGARSVVAMTVAQA